LATIFAKTEDPDVTEEGQNDERLRF